MPLTIGLGDGDEGVTGETGEVGDAIPFRWPPSTCGAEAEGVPDGGENDKEGKASAPVNCR